MPRWPGTWPRRRAMCSARRNSCKSRRSAPVPEYPARTLAEAIQSYWLVHLVINFIELPQVGSGIRFDVVFNPFYERAWLPAR